MVQLPGRESRLGEAPLASVASIVEHLMPALLSEPELPLAIFGHSLGGLVAFELAHGLRAVGRPEPLQLFLSATRPPQQRDNGLPLLHPLADDRLLAEIDRRYGGIPAALRDQRDLLELLLPMLRADVTALETYHRGERPLLDCPITAYAGTQDELSPPNVVAGWRVETTGPFALRELDGGHFFLKTHRAEVVDDIVATLSGLFDWPVAAR